MAQERRRAPRTGMRLTTWIKFPKTGKVLRVLTNDFSGVGLRLATDEPLTPGTTLGMEIKLPDREQTVQATVEVVWSRAAELTSESHESSTAETGVKFVSIDSKDLATIRQYAMLFAPPPE